MKIEELRICNFKGIKNMTVSFPQIVAICGKNGAGKTSLLDALRYALTGEEPKGDIIRYGESATIVDITIINDSGEKVTFTRIKEKEKPSKFKVNGKTTTQKSLNATLEDFCGIPIDKIKVLSSSEVIAMMQPQEFASLILEYIPEKLSLEKVMDFIPESTPGMIDIIDANLPLEGIDLNMLDDFDSILRATRKDLKASLQAKKLMYDKHIKEKPAEDKAAIERELKELINKDAEYKIFLEKERTYKTILETREKTLSKIKELRAEAEAMKVERPDPAALSRIQTEIKDSSASRQSQSRALAGVETALSTLKATLESIEMSVCPISPLITCKTDKTVAKEDITGTIKATEESREIIKKELVTIDEKFEKLQVLLQDENNKSHLYEKKLALVRQAKDMESSLPIIPEKPTPVEKSDTEAEEFRLNKALENIRNYEEGCVLAQEIEFLEIQVEDYESLVKLLAEKGPVRTGVVQSYLGIFEKICNERSESICPEITFTFKPENGVVVYMNDARKGTSLTINELSGGEKAYMLYILIDMLNELVGTRLLFLDELSVMDNETFDNLLKMVLKNIEDYDHVILSAVNHKEMVDGFNSNEIDIMKF